LAAATLSSGRQGLGFTGFSGRSNSVFISCRPIKFGKGAAAAGYL
jgi:hypothetical protein